MGLRWRRADENLLRCPPEFIVARDVRSRLIIELIASVCLTHDRLQSDMPEIA